MVSIILYYLLENYESICTMKVYVYRKVSYMFPNDHYKLPFRISLTTKFFKEITVTIYNFL